MFGYSPKNAVSAYSSVSIETGVLAADPHKLIVLLFDGAIKAICNAAQYMESKNTPEKGRSLSHAIAIIEGGLRASLNKDAGGDIAKNLDSLYGYMIRELLLANHQNDMTRLVEVKKLLLELRDAWEQIAPPKVEQMDYANVAKDDLAPRKTNSFSA